MKQKRKLIGLLITLSMLLTTITVVAEATYHNIAITFDNIYYVINEEGEYYIGNLNGGRATFSENFSERLRFAGFANLEFKEGEVIILVRELDGETFSFTLPRGPINEKNVMSNVETETETETETKTVSDSPKTGDNNPIIKILILVGLSAVIIIMITGKILLEKKRRW